MLSDKTGRRILRERPILNSTTLNLHKLKTYPASSFGRRFVDFMEANRISIDTREPVRYIRDPEIAYVMTRYRQVHDFWHVLVDLPPSVLGEIALKWFEWKTTGLPVCALSSLVGPLRLSSGDKKLLISVYIPWTLQSTVDCGELLSFRYEDSMHLPLTDIRQSLRITPAPTLLSH